MPAQLGLTFGPEALIILVSLYWLHPCWLVARVKHHGFLWNPVVKSQMSHNKNWRAQNSCCVATQSGSVLPQSLGLLLGVTKRDKHQSCRHILFYWYLVIFILWLWCFACLYVCTIYVSVTLGGQKGMPGPLGLELQVVVSSHGDAGNQSLII